MKVNQPPDLFSHNLNERMKTEAPLAFRIQPRNLKVLKRAIIPSRFIHSG